MQEENLKKEDRKREIYLRVSETELSLINNALGNYLVGSLPQRINPYQKQIVEGLRIRIASRELDKKFKGE